MSFFLLRLRFPEFKLKMKVLAQTLYNKTFFDTIERLLKFAVIL